MEAYHIKSSSMPAAFAAAEALFSETKAALASDSLIHAYHDEVERYAVEQGKRIVHALIQVHMDLRGQAVAIEPVVGKDGQERTHIRPDTARRLVTTVGKVQVPRVAYSGREIGALHPTDADLNLPTDSYSFEVTRKIAMTAAEQPFDATRKLFAEFTGVDIALRQVEQITRAAARDMDEFYQSGSRVFVPEKTSDILVLTVDQKGVVMRRQDLREQTRLRAEQQEPKLDSRLSKGEKPDRKRMATVAAVYTVAAHIRTAAEVIAGLRHLRPIADERAKPRCPRPEHKRVWASVTAEMREVVSQLFDEAERRDPLRNKRWFAVIDGDRKLKKAIEKEAKKRGVKVTLVLDFIHALEYLWRAGSALFDQGSKELEEWVLERLTALLEGKVSDVAAGIRRSATMRGLLAKQRKPVDRAANYFLKRKAMMRYDQLLLLGTPIASGVIEGTCRSLVNDRLDVTGARWSLVGAEAVLRLRAIVRSGDWNEYWDFHTHAEYERNHRACYENGRVPAVDIPRRHARLRVVK